MKFSVFHSFPSYGLPDGPWPNSPHLSRNDAFATDSMRQSLAFARAAEAAGVDQVSVAEQHHCSKQLSPSAVVAATLVAQAVDEIDVGLLGSTLPMVNPIRVAEEIGMLDAVANRRLLVGFFPGEPQDFLAYGTNPWESDEVFREQLDLLRAIWREPEPFAWVGRHFDYRTVAVWPQPTRELPVLIAANSPGSAAYAAKKGFIAGFSSAPASMAKVLADVYRAESEKAGRSVGAADMLYRAFAIIAETDEIAEELYARTDYGKRSGPFADGGDGARIATRIAAAVDGVPHDAPLPPEPSRIPDRPPFIGSPTTVAEQIRSFVEDTGVGRIELIVNDAGMPFEDAIRSLRLYGREVIPEARELIGPLV